MVDDFSPTNLRTWFPYYLYAAPSKLHDFYDFHRVDPQSNINTIVIQCYFE